jgi:hypothetical protein
MSSELTQLKQRLVAEQRRAEILDAEVFCCLFLKSCCVFLLYSFGVLCGQAHEIRKQHQHLSMRSPVRSAGSGKDGAGDAAV